MGDAKAKRQGFGLAAGVSVFLVLSAMGATTVSAPIYGNGVSVSVLGIGEHENNDEAGVQVTVAMVGEIGWCDDHPATWEETLQDRFENVLEPGFSEPDADLDLIWVGCTFTTDSWTYDHSVDDAAHCHSIDCGSPHVYAFNKVGTSPNHKVDDADDGDDTYMHAVPHFDGTDYTSRLGGNEGLEAYVWHFRQHDDIAEPDIVQLVHDVRFSYVDSSGDTERFGDWANDQPGRLNAFRFGWTLGTTHEMGHNLNADHCRAEEDTLDPGTWTVMVSSSDSSCAHDWDQRENEFSTDNDDRISNHVTSTYG